MYHCRLYVIYHRYCLQKNYFYSGPARGVVRCAQAPGPVLQFTKIHFMYFVQIYRKENSFILKSYFASGPANLWADTTFIIVDVPKLLKLFFTVMLLDVKITLPYKHIFTRLLIYSSLLYCFTRCNLKLLSKWFIEKLTIIVGLRTHRWHLLLYIFFYFVPKKSWRLVSLISISLYLSVFFVRFFIFFLSLYTSPNNGLAFQRQVRIRITTRTYTHTHTFLYNIRLKNNANNILYYPLH